MILRVLSRHGSIERVGDPLSGTGTAGSAFRRPVLSEGAHR